MIERYKKNIGFITEEEQNILLTKTICLLGLGGNGGYIAEFLVRLGIKKLILFEFDSFEESNLNRQTFCHENNLTKSKIEETIKALKVINSKIEYEYYNTPFQEESIPLIQKADLIINAMDSSNDYYQNSRNTLRQCLIDYKIPILEQAISNYGGRYTILNEKGIKIFDSMSKEWKNSQNIPEGVLSQPAFLCSLIASLSILEVYRYFCEKQYNSINKIFVYSLFENKIFRANF